MTATNEPYVWLCVDSLGSPFIVPTNRVILISPLIVKIEGRSGLALDGPPELCPLSNSLRIEAFLAGEDNG